MARFSDRVDAGLRLGTSLGYLATRKPLILGLARGGVPVASQVARRLQADLDVLTVRKIGVPYQPELAMGAVATGGAVIRNGDIIEAAGIDAAAFEHELRSALKELDDRELRFRGDSDPIPASGRWVVLVDDGIATGSTMLAAIEAVRLSGPHGITVAVPVAAPQTVRSIESHVDEVVAVLTPKRLVAVGAWYRDFAQTSDAEVRQLLLDHRSNEN